MNKIFDVIVVGELNVDLILNQIESFPEMGKEKLAEKMDLVLGSSSAIFASNLSSLGANVSYIGKVGKDIFGNLVMQSLKDKNVNTDLIIVDEKLKTGATIVLNYNEDRAMVTHAGAMEHLTITDIKKEDLQKAKHMHVSSVFLQPKVKENIVEIFKLAKESGLTTSLDTQWDPAEKWELDLKKLLPLVDVFIPNEEEIKHLTGKQNVKDAIDSIKEFANTIVVKMGSKGSVSFSNNKLTEVPAFLNNNVVDAIGAGDSFDAGFVFQFVKGKDIAECQTFGNLIGAINTTASGGTAAFKDFESIMEIAKKKFNYTL
jgi:sugar/nucleoside kinase (ribokinase family)